MNKDSIKPVMPWWRVPMVWLVVGGAALVVVASVVTLVIAVHGADVPLLRHGVAAPSGAHVPAEDASRHAAEPRR